MDLDTIALIDMIKEENQKLKFQNKKLKEILKRNIALLITEHNNLSKEELKEINE